MPQGYGKPVSNTRPVPYRLRQDLGYIPARAMAEGDGGGGITSTGGPTAPVLTLTPIALGDVLANLAGANPDVPAPTPFVFKNLTDVPASYVGQAGKVVTVKATEDGLEFDTASAGGASLLPLVNGDSPMGIMEGNLQTVGVPISAPHMDTRVENFAAEGVLAARPAAPVVPPGGLSCYLATDTGKFFVWDKLGTAWVQVN